MPVVPEDVGQVLVQGAAERHVEHLRAATDAQHRQAPIQRTTQQRELPGVAGGPRLIGGRMRLLAIRGRVQVVAAGNDQRVQAVEDRAHGLGFRRLGWQ